MRGDSRAVAGGKNVSEAAGPIRLNHSTYRQGAIRVLLVDDHTALRQALRLMLESSEGITVVGEATDGREAVELATNLHPDVVLMDVMMPGLNGIEATRRITRMSPGTRVIVFTAYLEPERLVRALRAGAAGYVVKRSDVAELLTAIQSVHRGNTFFSGDIAGDPRLGDLLMRARRDGATPGDEILSAREREVLQLIAEGAPRREIAETLSISVRTVDSHQTHIMAKLAARSRADLIRYALERGYVGTEPPALGDEWSRAS